MKRSIFGWLGALAGLVVGWHGAVGGEAVQPDPSQAPFEKMSGRELVEQLLRAEVRSRAFYELHRRSLTVEPHFARSLYGPDEGYEIFIRLYPAPEVTICPQAAGVLPIYLVTYNRGGLSRRFSSYGEEAAVVPRPHELFPPLPEYRQPLPDEDSRDLRAFNGEGRWVMPFDLSGFSAADLVDLTGDGILDYVFSTTCGLDPAEPTHIELLQIATAEDKSRHLLTLLLNWGSDEWTYRVRDTDGDGLADLELGPRFAAGIQPRVVFRWDKATGTFRGPEPKADDHFRVMQSGDDYGPAIKKFAAEGLRFPAEPEAVLRGADAPAQEQIKRAERPWEPFPSRLPPDFWTLDPKAAALAFAEANRSEDHRGRFRIALEDRDEARPPEIGSVMLTEGEQGCFGAHGSEWFLRFDPEESYLITAHSQGRHEVLEGSDLSLRWDRIPYAEARQIAAAIWWLDRLRIHPSTPSDQPISTTTHWRWLSVRDASGSPVLQRAEQCSFSYWLGTFDRKLHLEATAWLLAVTLQRQAGPLPTPSERRQERLDNRAGNAEIARRILERWRPDESRISHRLAAAAVRLLPLEEADVVENLRAIAAQIPAHKPPPGRTEEAIGTERNAVEEQHWNARRQTIGAADGEETPEMARLRDKIRALSQEAELARIRAGMDGSALLHTALASALRAPRPDPAAPVPQK